jgi:hypothetical protein
MCLVLVLSAKALSIVRATQIDVPAAFEGHFGMGAMAYFEPNGGFGKDDGPTQSVLFGAHQKPEMQPPLESLERTCMPRALPKLASTHMMTS